MAHVQRRCTSPSCRHAVEPGPRSCPRCGARIAWVARWIDPDGKAKSQSFAKKDDATAHLENTGTSKRGGDYIDPKRARVRVGEWLADWLEQSRPALKPKTALSYENLISSRIVPTLGKRELGDLRPSHVQGWVNAMVGEGLSASRIRQANGLLAQALDAAVGDNRIARNVARKVKLPKLERKEAPYLEPVQVGAIAREAEEPYGSAIIIMGTLGLRFGELAALRRRDVDLLRRRKVDGEWVPAPRLGVRESLAEVRGDLIFGKTKTHATRTVPLPADLARGLGDHLKTIEPGPDALLFTSAKGKPIRYSNWRREVWLPAVAAAKLPPVGVHVLRHSAAAAMIHAGATPKAVQTVLGHANAGFTLSVYAHLFDADLDELGDRMEGLFSAAFPTGTGPIRDHPSRARRLKAVK